MTKKTKYDQSEALDISKPTKPISKGQKFVKSFMPKHSPSKHGLQPQKVSVNELC